MLDALHETPDAREAEPERLDARFAIGLAAKEAAEHCDLAYAFALIERVTRENL